MIMHSDRARGSRSSTWTIQLLDNKSTNKTWAIVSSTSNLWWYSYCKWRRHESGKPSACKHGNIKPFFLKVTQVDMCYGQQFFVTDGFLHSGAKTFHNIQRSPTCSTAKIFGLDLQAVILHSGSWTCMWGKVDLMEGLKGVRYFWF